MAKSHFLLNGAKGIFEISYSQRTPSMLKADHLKQKILLYSAKVVLKPTIAELNADPDFLATITYPGKEPVLNSQLQFEASLLQNSFGLVPIKNPIFEWTIKAVNDGLQGNGRTSALNLTPGSDLIIGQNGMNVIIKPKANHTPGAFHEDNVLGGDPSQPSRPICYELGLAVKDGTQPTSISEKYYLKQDVINIMRQEFVNHVPFGGVAVPARSDFVNQADVISGTPFSLSDLNTHNYFSAGKILGNPAEIATDVLTQITAIILDDNQVVAKGTTNLLNKDVRVVAPFTDPDTKIKGFNYILTTEPYVNPDDPNDRDEKVSVQEGGYTIEYIVAGPDLDCDTYKNTNANVPWDINDVELNINSAWRNPERNEASAGSAVDSKHQVGNAADLKIKEIAPQKWPFKLTKAECNCITQTAASRGGNLNKYSTLPEYWGTKYNYCNDLHDGGLDLTHIHVQRK